MLFLVLLNPVASALSPAAREVLARPDRVTVYAVEPSPFVRHPALGFRRPSPPVASRSPKAAPLSAPSTPP